MASFCLTTGVSYGQGTIKQPGCEWAEKGPNPTDTCAFDFEEGSVINVIATPESSTWSVGGWVSSVEGVFTVDPGTSTTATIIMPSEDVTITVFFIHENVTLILDVGDTGGCIDLISPSGYDINCLGETVIIPSEQVGVIRAFATPNSGFQIEKWEVDGVDQSTTDQSLDVNLEGYPSRTVAVYFEAASACTEKTLTVNINGNGSVSPPSGGYCENLTLSLKAIPAQGYSFSGWTYDIGSGITLSENVLFVPMNVDRSITATFEEIKDFEDSGAVLFYCPSENYKDNVISFDYTSTFKDPSVLDMFHFRVTFYADVSKNQMIYSAFSLSDNKRWFYNNGNFNQIPSNGVLIEEGETFNITYDPEFLPHNLTDIQPAYLLNNNMVYEKPLICGIKYYVEIESYNTTLNTIDKIKTVSLILDCNKVNSFYWAYNKDNKNWLCSGQGKTDLQITSGNEQTINTDISSGVFGIYKLVWQGRRNSGNNIYGAQWDSNKDIVYSSGQGLYDSLELKTSFYPISITDQANNFYINSSSSDVIKFKACEREVRSEEVISEDVDGSASFASICYPGSANFLNSSYDTIKARIYKEDIDGSLIINNNKTVPVVSKKSIRVDIDGIVGAYAVRLRYIEDEEWGGWINIDVDLYGEEVGEDVTYDAYRIDNSRFIVPWDVSSNNGLKRICCQVLTLYGISNVFCIDMLSNFDTPQHVFEFYGTRTGSASNYEFSDPFPIYDGKYVLSIKNVKTLNDDGSGIVYFKTVFNQFIYADESNNISYVDGDIKFNVIQQGVNDVRNLSLLVIGDNKTFTGQFNIYNDDGIFNKDGNAFIELVLPGSVIAETCGEDNSDIYNLVNASLEEIANVDLDPEEIYENYKTEQLSKDLSLNELKQYYDKDDVNFKFGNPKYFKKDE
jgi:hypothetical protein